MPAISSNDTPVGCSTYTFARLLAMVINPLCGFIRFMTNIQSPKKITAGRIPASSVDPRGVAMSPVNRMCAASSSGTSPGSSTRVVTKSCTPVPARLIGSIRSFASTPSRPVSVSIPAIVSVDSTRSLTVPALIKALNSLYDTRSG